MRPDFTVGGLEWDREEHENPNFLRKHALAAKNNAFQFDILLI